MIDLFHYTLCPKSRFIRILLEEFDIKFQKKELSYFSSHDEIIKLNPSGDLPVIIDQSGKKICGLYTITEYLIELNQSSYLIPEDIYQRAEMRRLINWIMTKFQNEVTDYIISERLYCLFSSKSPKVEFLRAAKNNLSHHIDYFLSLILPNENLVYDKITISDIALASQISVLDYTNDIYWDIYPELKNWYMIIKSRPSFRKILNDRVSNIQPPKFYDSLDF